MSYASVIDKIKMLPDESLNDAENYIEFLLYKLKNKQNNKGKVKLGIAKGQFHIPDNIDTINDEIAKMFGVEQ
ncbi:MAG: DUF2281 domain-containing protein [Candidatus Riflebacteria bacterium]|nr:DUF2281 domain-containing protein [Candidatus Riflebacteria bacterium]